MTTETEKELRELDAWIAEHVMGFEWRAFNHRDKISYLTSPTDLKRDELRRSLWLPDPDYARDISSAFRYSTDPAAAIEVLKRCAEKVAPVSIRIYHNPAGWHVGIAEFEIAPTLEESICRFAKELFK